MQPHRLVDARVEEAKPRERPIVLHIAAAELLARRLEEIGLYDGHAVQPLARRLQEITPGLVNGVLVGILLSRGFGYAKNTLGLAVAYFALASIFSGVTLNGAAALGTALHGAITGDGVGFASSADWWMAFLAPIVGGILAGRMAPIIGK